MGVKKFTFVVTARASWARCRSIIGGMDQWPDIIPTVLFSGQLGYQKYGDVKGAKVDRIKCLFEGGNHLASVKTTGQMVQEIGSYFANEKPDGVLVVADRYETIAASIAASYQNIPLFHLQAGEHTGNIDDKVRSANSALADYFIACDGRVYVDHEYDENWCYYGCPAMDGLPSKGDGQLEWVGGVGADVDLTQPYSIIMVHPETNKEVNYSALIDYVKNADRQFLWFWSNSDPNSDKLSELTRRFHETEPANVKFVVNLPPDSFNILLANADCIVGNSSVAVREAAQMGVPAINIGNRQGPRSTAVQNTINAEWREDSIAGCVDYNAGRDVLTKNPYFAHGEAGKAIAKWIGEKL